MTDEKGCNPDEVVSLGTVAAQNIAARLGIENPKEIDDIRIAISDEMNTMGSHFTLAFADIQAQYEHNVLEAKKSYEAAVTRCAANVDEAYTNADARVDQYREAFNNAITEIESTFSFFEANAGKIIVVLAAVFALGATVGHFVKL